MRKLERKSQTRERVALWDFLSNFLTHSLSNFLQMKPLLFSALFLAFLAVQLRAQTEEKPFAPLDYFADKCARCHGDYGSFYGADFAKNLDDAKLAQVVKEMCEGPAQAPLDGKNLEALTAFHRAKRDAAPFVWVTGQKGSALDGELQGEVSPGAKVELRVENRVVKTTIPAKTEGHQWSVPLTQALTQPLSEVFEIRATLNDKTTVVKAVAGSFGP